MTPQRRQINQESGALAVLLELVQDVSTVQSE